MNIESKSKTFYYFLLFWIIIITIENLDSHGRNKIDDNYKK